MRPSPSLALLPALLLLIACPAAARPTVELLQLPERLELPLPTGTNQLFSVRVVDADDVWMAATPTAESRLPLQPMGDKWVFNLGDPRVAKVLAGAGQFQVFARSKAGEVAGSLPVQFVAARTARPTVEFKGADGTRISSYGWVDPLRIAALVITWKGPGAPAPVQIGAGAMRRTIAPGEGPEVEYPMDDALRAAWGAAGTLDVIDAEGRVAPLARAVPSTLAPASKETFRIVQRRSLEVPGSQGYLTVHLGDISGNRVPLTLSGADGTAFIEQRLMTQGERAEFALGPRRYVVVVERLVNLLVGDDHAELRIEPAAAALTTPAP